MRILLVDNSKADNAFFTPLLKERLRAYGVVASCRARSELTELLARPWDAAVLSGSSLNLTDPVRLSALSKDLAVLAQLRDTPVLGICFGMQLMAVAYGGHVERMRAHVSATRLVAADGDVVAGTFAACFSHGDAVRVAPPGWRVVARNGPYADAMESADGLRVGVQFHPERTRHSPVLAAFLDAARARRVDAFRPTPPLRETTDAPLSWAATRHVEHMMGRADVHALARQHRTTPARIQRVWDDFRARFRIPAMLV